MSTTQLDYLYPTAPAAGDSLEIVPGLQWLRQPLPLSLDHINVWMLIDEDSFAMVDTGINSSTSKKNWRNWITSLAAGKTPDRVIGTHLHPDHIGLAGWLCSTYSCDLWMTTNEYLLCRVLCNDTDLPAPQEAIEFYRAAGLGSTSLDHYKVSFGRFGKVVSPLPQKYKRIVHDDVLTLCGHSWRVVEGSGHSPEHACLYDEQRDILISGDQVLPKITSIVAVWPTEPEANPLDDWLKSCQRLIDTLPDTALVLPSHGIPFRGLHARLRFLIAHHSEALEKLHQFCTEPKRATDVYAVLFNSKINRSNEIMAIGEAIAHFNYLRNENMLERTTDSKGVHWYRAC